MLRPGLAGSADVSSGGLPGAGVDVRRVDLGPDAATAADEVASELRSAGAQSGRGAERELSADALDGAAGDLAGRDLDPGVTAVGAALEGLR
jgi:hypothetical protein